MTARHRINFWNNRSMLWDFWPLLVAVAVCCAALLFAGCSTPTIALWPNGTCVPDSARTARQLTSVGKRDVRRVVCSFSGGRHSFDIYRDSEGQWITDNERGILPAVGSTDEEIARNFLGPVSDVMVIR